MEECRQLYAWLTLTRNRTVPFDPPPPRELDTAD